MASAGLLLGLSTSIDKKLAREEGRNAEDKSPNRPSILLKTQKTLMKRLPLQPRNSDDCMMLRKIFFQLFPSGSLPLNKDDNK